jgi:hypothetical protein
MLKKMQEKVYGNNNFIIYNNNKSKKEENIKINLKQSMANHYKNMLQNAKEEKRKIENKKHLK